MKKIFYWSPHIDKVATVKAVINSAYSLKLYSKNGYDPYIINVAGEWDEYQSTLKEKGINLIKLTNSNIIKNRNIKGFIRSRLIYFYIFIIAFFPLINLLKKESPAYFIIHLIAPLPLLINYFFSFDTKFILRISGYPKLSKLRSFIWELTLKKILFITCPTIATKNNLLKLNIADNKKFFLLYDPIIYNKTIISEKINKLNKNDLNFKDYFMAAGRLTKQKNFLFLIDAFKDFNKDGLQKLVILGDGEDKNILSKYIKDNHLEKSIYLLGYKKNIFKYFEKAKCFILSSLWEDPGFVIVEASYMNLFVISSDCKNGPNEILDNGNNGILYETNNKKALVESLKKYVNMSEQEIFNKKKLFKNKIKNFTIFNHYKELIKIIDCNNYG
jgi:glycosyltransferase involved in cell wall biosynthesis